MFFSSLSELALVKKGVGVFSTVCDIAGFIFVFSRRAGNDGPFLRERRASAGF